MSIVLKFAFVFICFVFMGSCASSCGSSQGTNTNTSENKVIVPKRSDNTKIPENSNGNTKMVPYNSGGNTNVKNPTLDNSKVKVIDTKNIKVKIPKKRMPDNSEMSTQSKGASFVETRKFLSHPQLDKLERVINSGDDIKVKIYLKNGKVYEIEKGKLKDYKKDSAAVILKAVGIEPAARPSSEADSKTQKDDSK